ncbi:MAG: hypothetical protein H0U37_02780 [Chloroflexi bacterium]|nr:hypothetical protein [Chloroflexota bacterium]
MVTAECDDEKTTIIIANPGDRGAALVPDREALAGEYGRTLVLDHQARCESCQRGAATVESVAEAAS